MPSFLYSVIDILLVLAQGYAYDRIVAFPRFMISSLTGFSGYDTESSGLEDQIKLRYWIHGPAFLFALLAIPIVDSKFSVTRREIERVILLMAYLVGLWGFGGCSLDPMVLDSPPILL
ncbi:hypothetical protein BDP55DRAFT_629483 [Colletotrichum godetiae]|uniref:Uncharacterized protein n=1 Tax=Colletotrichum godetiae TaxID=1209918 RepID=A0AAJ0F0X2_9PEZI|nr:uncharacterized protein BDP55DRAFT_629483 [Colletotrichum godetiae]KAK1688948.1 hypothetical protein BDP55DRAFT_629483 [Colletotrichum godetiae]